MVLAFGAQPGCGFAAAASKVVHGDAVLGLERGRERLTHLRIGRCDDDDLAFFFGVGDQLIPLLFPVLRRTGRLTPRASRVEHQSECQKLFHLVPPEKVFHVEPDFSFMLKPRSRSG